VAEVPKLVKTRPRTCGSLIPVFIYIQSVPGSTGAQMAILDTMHVVAACVIVRMLTMADRSPAR